MSTSSTAADAVENQRGWAPETSASEAPGTPVPEGPETSASEFPGPKGLVRDVGSTHHGAYTLKGRGGRPRRYGKPLNLPLTDAQRRAVDDLADADGCSAAEAIRRLIDGRPTPQPVERVAVDPDAYRELLDALGGIRTELNRGVGNLYRLTRDAYSAWQVPEPDDLAALRQDLAAGLSDLAALAERVREVSPW